MARAPCIGLFVDAVIENVSGTKVRWAEAQIINCMESQRHVKVHFVGYNAKYDAWIDEYSLAAHGAHCLLTHEARTQPQRWDGQTDLFVHAVAADALPTRSSSSSSDDDNALLHAAAAASGTRHTGAPASRIEPVDSIVWTEDATTALVLAWDSVQRADPHLQGEQLAAQVHQRLHIATEGHSQQQQLSFAAIQAKLLALTELYERIERLDARAKQRALPLWSALDATERQRLWSSEQVPSNLQATLSQAQFAQIDTIINVRKAIAATTALAVEVSQPPAMSTQRGARSEHDSGFSETLRHFGALDEMNDCYCAARGELCDDCAALAEDMAMHGQAHKRARTDTHDDNDSRTQRPAVASDFAAATARMLEQMRVLHEQDRAERRQQHAELLAAMQQLTAVMRPPPPR